MVEIECKGVREASLFLSMDGLWIFVFLFGFVIASVCYVVVETGHRDGRGCVRHGCPASHGHRRLTVEPPRVYCRTVAGARLSRGAPSVVDPAASMFIAPSWRGCLCRGARSVPLRTAIGGGAVTCAAGDGGN